MSVTSAPPVLPQPQAQPQSLPAAPTGAGAAFHTGQVALLLLGALLLLPLLALAVAGVGAVGSGTLAHLFRTVLAETVWVSALLACGTLAGTLAIGVACAWCVERYDFAGRAV
ncbi:MAG: hypothetical protein ACRCV9_13650, partial [Burkholderiaceae bacterium]